MPPGRSLEARCDASELRNRTRNFESGKEASMRRIGTPYSNSELRIRERSFDASHRFSVFQLGTPNPEKKLRRVASGLRIPTRSFESGKEASMRRIGTPYSNSELRIWKRSFDASHRDSVIQLGIVSNHHDLRC